MKDIELSVKKESDGVAIYSADGKNKYAFLRKLGNGKIVRTFYTAVSDGILSEGTNCSDMKEALTDAKEMIKQIYELNPKAFKSKH